MSPEDRTGALLIFTCCVAALTLVLWIEWVSSQDRGLFTSAPGSLVAAQAEVVAGDRPGR
jgi:hypothetical protein